MVAWSSFANVLQVADRLDGLYGRPGHALRRAFQEGVRRILAVDTWDAFFDAVGLLRPSPEQLTAWLRQSWRNSLAKGYHRQVRSCALICCAPQCVARWICARVWDCNERGCG
jgi:hypothetical protein